MDLPLTEIGLNSVWRFHENILSFTFSVIVDADPSGNSCHYANFLVGGTTGLYIMDYNFLVHDYNLFKIQQQAGPGR